MLSFTIMQLPCQTFTIPTIDKLAEQVTSCQYVAGNRWGMVGVAPHRYGVGLNISIYYRTMCYEYFTNKNI